MDEQIGTFVAFTAATEAQAQQYLALTDGNVEQAVELFFSNPDLGSGSAPRPPSNQNDPITIDDDDDDDDVHMTGSRPAAPTHSVEDDEAMARRLQEEMYGAGGGGGGGGRRRADVDDEGYRAPMARTTETLVGPGSDWRDDPDAMNSAIFEQLQRRQMGGSRSARPGIFNQQPSIWANNDDPSDPDRHRHLLSRATGGASEQSAKSNLLAELFKPPVDLVSPLPWSEAREEGKESLKWLLVNVQDPSIFDCQVLNRDIWKNGQIRDAITEHFIFLQYNKADPRGREYIQYYFATMADSEDAYPHIAIVDPRTGEQVKTWSGSPGPKPADFLMDLHEFLDRYSLSFERKNPVQRERKERKKDVGQMTEDEMLEMAMQNSLANGGEKQRDADPDALTRSQPNGKGKERMKSVPEVLDTADLGPVASQQPQNGSASDSTQPASGSLAPARDAPFARISSTSPHTEPGPADPETTRIQFRYSGGRVVRRFALADPVRRMYEWLKASPVAGKEGTDFELIAMGKNLIESLETPIGEAGLRNGTVMVEFIGGDGDED